MGSTAGSRRIHRFALLLACAWPLSLHAAILSGNARWAPVVTALAMTLGLVLWALARRSLMITVVAVAMTACLGIFSVHAPAVLIYAPPVLINTALAVVFAMSLRASRVPIITRYARLEHDVLPPELAQYARTLTLAWALLFAAMAVVSLALAAFGSVNEWSTFSNLMSYLLVGLLFLGEWFYRRRRFREYRHATLPELVRNVRRAGLFTLQRPTS